jgi:hypothetical protein
MSITPNFTLKKQGAIVSARREERIGKKRLFYFYLESISIGENHP